MKTIKPLFIVAAVLIAAFFAGRENASAGGLRPGYVEKLLAGEEISRCDFGLSRENIEEIKEAVGNTATVRETYTFYRTKSESLIMEEQAGISRTVKIAVLVDASGSNIKKIIVDPEPDGALDYTGASAGESGKSRIAISAADVLAASKRALAVYAVFLRGGLPKPGTAAVPAAGKPKHTAEQVTITAETAAFINAAAKGDKAGVLRQLEAGAELNGKTMDKLMETALMKASAKGHTEVVRLLIARGADINMISRFGFTALMFAAESGNADTVNALLDAGADVNAVGHMWATALNWAKTEKIKKMLIKAGAK